MAPRSRKKAPSSLKVIPLGGLGDIGKNMLVLETAEDIVVIDAGVLFPELDMPGIQVVVPNIDYLRERLSKLRGILITHGHEDHIGGLPHVIQDLKAPVYAPRMAADLIRNRLREYQRLESTQLHTIRPGEPLRLGQLEIEWFEVCHSIPDSMGIAIRTPLGTVVHTGDFKIDHDPIIGYPTDFANMARIAQDGVFLLLSDSTYAEDEGYTESDRVVAESLFKMIGDARGRVFVASFASQIARIQMVADSAIAHGRRLALMGRSMINNVKVARELGHLDIPDHVMMTPAEAAALPDSQVIFMTTGSQGEPGSALVRISRGDHREARIRSGDTVIVSASPIPGNEVAVYAAIDDLVEQGAHVLYGRNSKVHVHGHASREELRIMLNIMRPKYFVPVHGEFRMLKAHVSLAADQGVPEDNTFIITDGDVLELDEERGKVVDRIAAGHVFVHGLGIWDESGNVLIERRALARDGIVFIALALDGAGRVIPRAAKIVSAGFVHTLQADVLFEDTLEDLRNVLDRNQDQRLEWAQLELLVRNTVGKFLNRRTRRRPLIIPVSVDTK